MAFPIYQDSANSFVRSASVDITLMATVNADDIIIVQYSTNATTTLTVPSGFTEFHNGIRVGDFETRYYWKRMAGTEGGSIDTWETSGLGTGTFITYYRFSGCITTGNPYEELSFVNHFVSTSTSVTHSNNASLGDDRLALMMYHQDDNFAVDRSGSDANYTQSYLLAMDIAVDNTHALETQDIATSATVDGDVIYDAGSRAEYISLVGIHLIPPAAGGNDIISGTSDLTFTDTSTITGKGSITATSTINFTSTSILESVGVSLISGSTGLTFSESLILNGKGAILGTADLIFTENTTLLARGSLAGISDLSFIGNSTLQGTGLISGLGSIVFTESASIANGSNAQLSLDPTSIIFTSISSLVGKGLISGVSNISFTSVGSIANGSNAQLSLDPLTLNFTESALLTGKGVILGVSDISFVSVSTLENVSSGQITGTSLLNFTSNSTLLGKTSLVCATTISFTSLWNNVTVTIVYEILNINSYITKVDNLDSEINKISTKNSYITKEIELKSYIS